MTNAEKLRRIAEIIEAVDDRCLAADGPVTPTLNEMRQEEISEIYRLAKEASLGEILREETSTSGVHPPGSWKLLRPDERV